MLTVTPDKNSKVPRKNVSDISVYVKPDVKVELEKWAEREQRTLSSLCAYLLTQALEEYQQEQVQKPKGK